jgi:hypothetical protein
VTGKFLVQIQPRQVRFVLLVFQCLGPTAIHHSHRLVGGAHILDLQRDLEGSSGADPGLRRLDHHTQGIGAARFSRLAQSANAAGGKDREQRQKVGNRPPSRHFHARWTLRRIKCPKDFVSPLVVFGEQFGRVAVGVVHGMRGADAFTRRIGRMARGATAKTEDGSPAAFRSAICVSYRCLCRSRTMYSTAPSWRKKRIDGLL